MTVRKATPGKNAPKKLKVKKQTLKDLAPKGGKKVGGGRVYTPLTFYCTGACQTAMTYCWQLTCQYTFTCDYRCKK